MLAAAAVVLGCDLDHRADHHERPVRPHARRSGRANRCRTARRSRRRSRSAGGSARPGRRDRGWPRGPLRNDRGRPTRGTDGPRVAVLLGLVEARAAGEDEVGLGDQFLLQVEQHGRRETEFRQLVHAVIDDDVGVDAARERQHHRRVIPGDDGPADRRSEGLEQARQRLLRRRSSVSPSGRWGTTTRTVRKAVGSADFDERQSRPCRRRSALPKR